MKAPKTLAGPRAAMRCGLLLLSVLSGALSTGCDAGIRNIHEQRLLSHLGGLKSYQGKLTETGLLPGGAKLVSEINYARPGLYRIRGTAPEAFRGMVMTYSGSRLVIYYPSVNYAIEFVNLQPLNAEEQDQLVKDAFNSNLDHYLYDVQSPETVAGLPAVHLAFEAKVKTGPIASGSSDVYDELSFPLSLRLAFKDGAEYAYQFSQIAFNSEPPAKESFDFAIPSGTIVSRWDADSRGYTPEEATREAGFKFRLPRNVPRQMHLKKLIRQAGPIAAFTAMYENRPYYLNVTVFKDYGLNAATLGVKLKDKKQGELLPGPHGATYSFTDAGTRYIVFGNPPLNEFLSTVDAL